MSTPIKCASHRCWHPVLVCVHDMRPADFAKEPHLLAQTRAYRHHLQICHHGVQGWRCESWSLPLACLTCSSPPKSLLVAHLCLPQFWLPLIQSWQSLAQHWLPVIQSWQSLAQLWLSGKASGGLCLNSDYPLARQHIPTRHGSSFSLKSQEPVFPNSTNIIPSRSLLI